MNDESRKLLEKIIAYCDDRWVVANKAAEAAYPTPDTQLGKKMAYNDVMHFARSLLIAGDSDPPASR